MKENTFIKLMTIYSACLCVASIGTVAALSNIQENMIEHAVEDNNFVDDFELDYIRLNEQTVEFIGEKTTEESKEYGAYSYTIPAENDSYASILSMNKINETNVINLEVPVEELTNLINTENATWHKFTKDNIVELNGQLKAAVDNIPNYKLIDENLL